MDNLNNILTYDIFIFDFDGVIIDSEKIHNNCWNIVLKKYNIHFNYYNYCKTFHTNQNDGIRNNLKNDYNIIDFDELCNKKNLLYHEYIINNEISLIEGIKEFLLFLQQQNKKIIIATNTNKNNVEFIFKKYLKSIQIDDIISREMIKNKKPNPKVYNIIHNKFNNKKYVIFEDSLSGIEAIYKSNLNDKINNFFFINSPEYYHYKFIINTYNVNYITKFDIKEINKLLNKITQ
jgi:HAD superfamily hydrolase (TIGR01509 family)